MSQGITHKHVGQTITIRNNLDPRDRAIVRVVRIYREDEDNPEDFHDGYCEPWTLVEAETEESFDTLVRSHWLVEGPA